MKKPYLPLMMGDWSMMTSGLRADAKGVMIGLMIHQYHHGQLPQLLEDLALIEPEVGKVWVTIQRFFPVVGEGMRRNPELEEVRAFWAKQSKNGATGGAGTHRKAKANPEQYPNLNPNSNPDASINIDLDPDTDQGKEKEQLIAERCLAAFDDRTMEIHAMRFKELNLAQELEDFKIKLSGAWENYRHYDTAGLRSAFMYQLRHAPKQQPNGKHRSNGKQAAVDQLVTDHARRHSQGNA